MFTGFNESTTDRIIGHIDVIDSNCIIHGWAVNLSAPKQECPIVVKAGGRTLASGFAKQRRADLIEKGIGTGEHGFAIQLDKSCLSENDSLSIEVYAGESQCRLAGAELSIPSLTSVPSSSAAVATMHEFLSSRSVAARIEIEKPEICRLLNAIQLKHGTSLALAMAYVALLKRPIDSHGMETKKQSIESDQTTIARICEELINSHEFYLLAEEDFDSPIPSLTAILENA